MSIHNTYAIILEEKVINIIVADNFIVANECARLISSDVSVVECNDYRCSIGDIYKDCAFYFKDGVTPIPEEISADAKLEKLANEIETSNADMLYQICLLRLGMDEIPEEGGEEDGV